jgi:hypothetical protein
MLNLISSLPGKNLIIASAGSTLATAAVMTYGLGNVVNSILACVTHPVGTFSLGIMVGLFIGVAGLAFGIKHNHPKEWEIIFSSKSVSPHPIPQ